MADPFASLDLDALVKQATAAPPSTAYVGDTIKRVRDLESQKQAETAPIVDRMKSDFAADRKEVEAKTPQPADVTAWTQKLPEAHPVEAFGSFGSVFGILASAATHQPWQTAMTAASSAMNAVRANDIATYKDAYQAWKGNTDLMLKRHDEQYKDFQAAMEKMKTDTAEGNAMLTAMSAKYGDQITEAYKEAGLNGELVKVWEARQRAAQGLLETMPRIEDLNTQVTLVHDLKTAHDEERQARLTGGPAQIEAARQKTQDAEQNVRDYATVKYPSLSAGGRSPQAVALNAFIQDYQAAHDGAYPPAEDIQRYLAGVRGSAKTGSVTDFIAQYTKEQRDAGSTKSTSELELEARAKWTSNLTGNQRQKLEDRVDQFDNSADKIDQSIGVLDKYIGAAGLSGKALRGKEIVSNIFGSSETDRVQLRRNIEYLQQTLSHRLLTDASGRPLSADAKKLDDVIGGLSIGDTTANTLRSLNEVKRLYAKMRADTVSQLEGTWKPRDGGAAPTANSSDKPWLDAPVVK